MLETLLEIWEWIAASLLGNSHTCFGLASLGKEPNIGQGRCHY